MDERRRGPTFSSMRMPWPAETLDAAVADFSEELRPQAPQTAQDLLPLPVTAAEVLSVDIGDSEAVVGA